MFGASNESGTPPVSLNHHPFLFPRWIVLHICPRNHEFVLVGGPQIKLASGLEIRDLEDVKELIQPGFPIDTIPLALLLSEH